MVVTEAMDEDMKFSESVHTVKVLPTLPYHS